jgi:hypothetical protein
LAFLHSVKDTVIRKVNTHVYDWAMGGKGLDIVEGSAPSKTKEETLEAPTTKKKMMAVHAD